MLDLFLQIMLLENLSITCYVTFHFYRRNQGRKATKFFHEFQITETIIRPYHKIACVQCVQLVIWHQELLPDCLHCFSWISFNLADSQSSCSHISQLHPFQNEYY